MFVGDSAMVVVEAAKFDDKLFEPRIGLLVDGVECSQGGLGCNESDSQGWLR